MIHKRYRRNGTPDLRRWIFECDHCHCRHNIGDIKGWLIPEHPKPGVRTYCPPCVNRIAAVLILVALRSA
ncbi:hypothetical protein [Sphaerisporangium perillae]|uniref:hypothetical protein n=1 Tax=Sphaerisporangium perillae TaxID=2935860 RepID=UPI00200E67B8|nr:hypothetical protein [Sphaerisporangium perillae]